MSEKNQPLAGISLAAELIRTRTEAELALLRQERKAERKLANALKTLERDLERLRGVQAQVSVSQQLVEKAEESLRECQTRRAVGPVAFGEEQSATTHQGHPGRQGDRTRPRNDP